jgi:hypothetical protein
MDWWPRIRAGALQRIPHMTSRRKVGPKFGLGSGLILHSTWELIQEVGVPYGGGGQAV